MHSRSTAVLFGLLAASALAHVIVLVLMPAVADVLAFVPPWGWRIIATLAALAIPSIWFLVDSIRAKREWPVVLAGGALSFGTHVGLIVLIAFLYAARSNAQPAPPVEVEIATVEEPEPEPEEEEEEIPEPEPPPPEPEPEFVPMRPRPIEEPEPEPAPPPPPQAEAIEEFAGVTLTNDGPGESWASNVGNGQEITAPIGQPNARITGRARQGVPDGVPGGTGEPASRVVTDLSRSPAPDLDRLQQLLQHNFPRRARDLGVEGFAVVSVYVHADGRIEPERVVRESERDLDFGQACIRTLREGGRWDPPLDRQGRAVDTRTNFRCTFTVNSRF